MSASIFHQQRKLCNMLQTIRHCGDVTWMSFLCCAEKPNREETRDNELRDKHVQHIKKRRV